MNTWELLRLIAMIKELGEKQIQLRLHANRFSGQVPRSDGD